MGIQYFNFSLEMKAYIVLFIATSTFAIPTKRSWTEQRYNQEIEPLKAEIQQDVNENVKDELFDLIFNSTYSEKQEFRNEISEMKADEKLYLTKNLEFILNGNVSLNYDDQYNNDNYTNDGSFYFSPVYFVNDNRHINGNDTEMDDTDEYDEEYDDENDYEYDEYDSSYDHDDDYYQSEFNLGDFDDAKDAMKNDTMKNDAMINKDFDKNSPMTNTEQFDLPDDRKMHLNAVLETYKISIIGFAILSVFMIPPTVIFWIAMCCIRRKRKSNADTEPILNSKPKIIIKKIACMKTKADAQAIKVGECTMIYKN